MSAHLLLELDDLVKDYGGFRALHGVSLHVLPGEILALLGENGAGKSTLLQIVSGNQKPTHGELRWQNKPVLFSSPRDATALGIGIVHQHFQLVPSFTVAENLALASPQARMVYSRQEWQTRIESWAHELGWNVDASQRIENLGVGERQRIEIIKALYAHGNFSEQSSEDSSPAPAKLLLFDEPTANLTPAEVEELFGVLRHLKDRGCGIVFVSHKLNEVLELSDRIAVLRRGQMVGERTPASTNVAELTSMMIGQTFSTPEVTPQNHEVKAEIALEIKGLSCGLLKDFSLCIHTGEIVGVAGVDGNGQSELFEVLSGQRLPDGCERCVQLSTFNAEAFASLHASLALVPPDRQRNGLISTFSLTENMALHPALRAQCRRFLSFDWRQAQSRTRALMQKFDVRAPQAQEHAKASQLSGGNQQKLIIARALSFPHRVVVAVDPTRGLDVVATQFVRQQLRQAANDGAGVLLISTDLDEIFALSDRIGVLYGGRLTPSSQLLPPTVTRDAVGKLMGGYQRYEPEGELHP